MDKAFSIEESLRFGWEKTKEHSFVLFEVLLTLFALNIVSGIINSEFKGTALGGLLSLVIWVAGVVLGTGFLVISLKIAKNEPAVYRDIVPSTNLVIMVFIASLLVGVLVFAGLILLVIPGIYFILRFSMVRYEVIEGAGIMESFERSTKLTDGYKWQLLGFFLVLILINIVGALILLVGLLVTIPVSMIAAADVYLKLKQRAGEPMVVGTPSPAAYDHHEHTHEHGHDHHDHGHDHSDHSNDGQ